jgi:hypothetical protein
MAGFEKWDEALAEAVAEGAGCIAIRLIDIRQTRILLEATKNQDPGGTELRDLSAGAEIAEAMRTQRRHRAPRCLICQKPLFGRRNLASCMLMRAARDHPAAIFAVGICRDCVRAAGGHQHLWGTIEPILREASPGLHDISLRIADVPGQA